MEQKTPLVELKEYISRVKDITNDCRTFLWARLEHYEEVKDKDLEIGGGNILIANGLFSCLSYLSKIYVQLANIATRSGRYNEIDETDAFQKLIFACPEKLGLDGLGVEDIKEVWRKWRNKLAHVLVQREGTAVTYDVRVDESLKGQYIEFRKKIELGQEGKSFTKHQEIDWWYCRVDILAVEIDEILSWITNQCDVYPNQIKSTLEWVKNELENVNLMGQEFIDKVKALGFQLGQYVVVGSGTLAALGIRPASDIDVTVSPELFDKLRASGEWKEEVRYDRIFLEKPGTTIIRELSWSEYPTTTTEAIQSAIIIDGVPFLNLPELKKFKTAMGRDNDKRDIALIDEYLKTNGSTR